MVRHGRTAKNRNIRGQSALEYAVLVACIVGGLVAMQVYVKRSSEGRVKPASDSLSDQQYDFKAADTDITTTVNSNYTIKQKEVAIEGEDPVTHASTPLIGIQSDYYINETTERIGHEKIGQSAIDSADDPDDSDDPDDPDDPDAMPEVTVAYDLTGAVKSAAITKDSSGHYHFTATYNGNPCDKIMPANGTISNVQVINSSMGTICQYTVTASDGVTQNHYVTL